jgi:hypothetical protein
MTDSDGVKAGHDRLNAELRRAGLTGTPAAYDDPAEPVNVEPPKPSGLAGGPRNGAPAPRRDFNAEASAALREQFRRARAQRHDND